MNLNPELQSARGGRVLGSCFQISQTLKKSGAEEIVHRGAERYFKLADIMPDDKVNVLYDPKYKVWILEKTDKSGGYKVNGKSDSPTLFVRYTLKDGMARISDKKETVKQAIEDENIYVEKGRIYLNAAG